MSDLRIGVLGAARIAPMALVKPARRVPGVKVAAVAARDAQRAREFAAKHGIDRVHTSYDDLIDDPDLDAVYIPLPNGLHAQWTARAIAAGKHVLCEKPFAANEEQARQVADLADASSVVVMEAFHYRYTKLAERLHTLTHDGTIGEIESVKIWMVVPIPKLTDIRFDYALGGGASMDACYPVHLLRLVGPDEPQVVAADATTLRRDRRVDRTMWAEYRFGTGAIGRTRVSLLSPRVLRISARIDGSRGRIGVFNYIAPQYGNLLSVTAGGKTTRQRVRGEPSYDAQLRAFVAAVREGAPFPTTARDAVTTAHLIDDIYRAAGLPLR